MDKEKTLEEMTEDDFKSSLFQFIQSANFSLPNFQPNHSPYTNEVLSIPYIEDKIKSEAPVGTSKYAFSRTDGEINVSRGVFTINYYKKLIST